MQAFSFLTGLAAFCAACAPMLSSAERAHSPAAITEPATKLDLNTADLSSLEAIPEIGARFAHAVVAARPFKSVDELQPILKLSPKHREALHAKVTALPVSNGSSARVSIAGTSAAATHPTGSSAAPASDEARRACAKKPNPNHPVRIMSGNPAIGRPSKASGRGIRGSGRSRPRRSLFGSKATMT